jgi:hypothetical protein
VTREEHELGRQVSDAEYAWLQAKVMTAAFTRAEYDRLWAAARARREFPPFVCKIGPQASKSEPQPKAGS